MDRLSTVPVVQRERMIAVSFGGGGREGGGAEEARGQRDFSLPPRCK